MGPGRSTSRAVLKGRKEGERAEWARGAGPRYLTADTHCSTIRETHTPCSKYVNKRINLNLDNDTRVNS